MRVAVLVVLALAGCITAPPAPAEGNAPQGGTQAGGWQTLAPLPEPRTENAAVGVAGKVWSIGGIFDAPQGGLVGRVDVYDPVNDSWSEGPPLPHALHHTAVVALGTKILVLGGYVNSPQFVPLAETWILDAASEDPAWERWTPLPAPRGAHAAATDGRHVFIVGGIGAPGPLVYPYGVQYLPERTAWRIDTQASTPTWSPMPPLLDARDHLGAAVIDGKLYVVGGRYVFLDRNVARLDVYDIETNAWSTGPRMPTERGGIGVVALDGRLVVAGGEALGGAFDDVEVFDPATRTWSAGPPLPEPRHGVGAAVLGSAMYVVGGGPVPAFAYSDTTYRWDRSESP